MNGLVKMSNAHPVVSTFDLFEQMGYREHRQLKKVITDNIEAFNDYGLLQLEMTKPKKKSEGGRPVEAFLINEDQFILLVLLAKNTPISIILKVRVAKEFKRLKKVVAELASQRKDPSHKAARIDGKEIYKQKTDVIKEFVEYATKQGSKSAYRYYGNLAEMENTAMFIFEHKFPNMREVMNIKQLMQVAIADDVIEKALKEGMEKGMHYKKEIFPLAKKRVIAFADIIGQSPILQLTQESKT